VAGAAGAAGAPDVVCDPVDVAPPLSLVHRYSFDGTGPTIVDSVGAPNATLMGTDGSTLDGAGKLVLHGYDGYVDLPDGLMKKLTEVTIMAWVSWHGGGAWQRIFDFGTTKVGADPIWKVPMNSPAGTPEPPAYGGAAWLAASPYNNWPPAGNLGVELKTAATPTGHFGAVNSMKDDVMHQVTVVFQDHVGVHLYLDGQAVGMFASPLAKLADLQDVNNWLGRSQTSRDPAYEGQYTEFRIYDRALTPCAIANEFAAGPDSPTATALP
jgi:hypothetical protein